MTKDTFFSKTPPPTPKNHPTIQIHPRKPPQNSFPPPKTRPKLNFRQYFPIHRPLATINTYKKEVKPHTLQTAHHPKTPHRPTSPAQTPADRPRKIRKNPHRLLQRQSGIRRGEGIRLPTPRLPANLSARHPPRRLPETRPRLLPN